MVWTPTGESPQVRLFGYAVDPEARTLYLLEDSVSEFHAWTDFMTGRRQGDFDPIATLTGQPVGA